MQSLMFRLNFSFHLYIIFCHSASKSWAYVRSNVYCENDKHRDKDEMSPV